MKTPIFDSSIKNNVKELQKYEGKTVKVLVTDTFGFSQSITGIFSFRNSSSFLIHDELIIKNIIENTQSKCYFL